MGNRWGFSCDYRSLSAAGRHHSDVNDMGRLFDTVGPLAPGSQPDPQLCTISSSWVRFVEHWHQLGLRMCIRPTKKITASTKGLSLI
jgi:hypothetical protein